ncbi:AAA family ATPase [Nostoc sp. FACHB-888]|uniref:AAA family ATPase n=1 Tax=Nostoc sp. FACHB-888 TaxID=2692842 RepID=UPI001689ADED|nr:AAA family ATPase [Nostoc sp. FACHB-888]
MMLVCGYAGVGKSALVQELYKPITAKRGYFVSGKFDPFESKIPYSAIANALQKLVQQLKVIAHKAVPDRPGRSESRVRKRRPKIYPLMTKPRHQWEQTIANCLNRKCFGFS